MSVVITGAAAVLGAPLVLGEETVVIPVAAPAAPPLDHLAEAVRVRAARAERLPQLVLAAGGAALAAAGLDAAPAPRARAGIVLGTAFGCLLTNDAYERRVLADGPPGASPRLFAATVSNAAAGELAIACGLAGPSVTLTAGAAAGIAALGHAADLIANGRAEAVVAGGADAAGAALARWLGAGGLAGPPDPIDGAVCLVLEAAGGAARRGARVRATIDGHAIGFAPTPDAARALAATIASACAAAGVAPAEVRHVAGSARAVRLVHATVETDARLVVSAVAEAVFAAAGPLALLAGLAAVPHGAPLLVVEACPSGHVAALVARRCR